MKTELTPQQFDHSEFRQAELQDCTMEDQDRQITFTALRSLALQPVSEVYQGWLNLFQNSPTADLAQHPDQVARLAPFFEKSHPQFPGYLMECRQAGELAAIGILFPKTMSTKYLKAIGPAVKLVGYVLYGDGFLLVEEYQKDEHFQQHLLEAALEFCQKQNAVFLLLEDVILGTPLRNAIKNASSTILQYSHTGLQGRNLIHFPEQAQDYWKTFRSKSRRKHRKLLRENSEMRMVRITEPDQVADFLESAHQISLNTWQTQRLGLRVKNDSKELEELTFWAINGWLRSYLLMKGDQPVAFKIGSQHRGVYQDREFGFDMDFASYSPGEALLLMILEDLTEHDSPHTYDFGEGDAEYKRRFSNEITKSGSVLLFPPTVRNKVRLKFFNSSRNLDQFARKCLKASGIYTTLRQIARYGKPGSR